MAKSKQKLMDTAKFERCVRFATQATEELIDNIKRHGWQKWRDNWVRETVGSKYGETFTNTESPRIYDEVKRRRPDLANWFSLKKKQRGKP